MDLIDREEVHDIIAMHLSDYMTDETREELEELDIKVEEDIPTVQAVPIDVLQEIRQEIEEQLKEHEAMGEHTLGFRRGLYYVAELIDTKIKELSE